MLQQFFQIGIFIMITKRNLTVSVCGKTNEKYISHKALQNQELRSPLSNQSRSVSFTLMSRFAGTLERKSCYNLPLTRGKVSRIF